MKRFGFFLLIFLFLFFEKGWSDTSTLLCLYEGPVTNAITPASEGGAYALQFTPPFYPAIVDSVQIYIISEGDPYWPWPDSIHQPFQVSIFADGGGFPGTEIFSETLLADDISPSWVMAYPNVTIFSRDFFLAFVNLTSFPEMEAVAADSNNDYLMRSWFRVSWSDTTWNSVSTLGDLLMCSYVSYPIGMEEDPLADERSFKSIILHAQPNPFNQFSVISYQLSVPSHTSLVILDLTGRLVETLVNEFQEPGVYQFPITRNQLPGSGIYFYRLSTSPTSLYQIQGGKGDFTQTRKLLLIR